ncbi:MarR family winged helix-turn-helix transcriptional regulator [Nocardia sp. NPDC004278]
MESPDRDASRTLDGRLGYLLVRAAMRVRQRYTAVLSVHGLLPNQHAILSRLNEIGPSHQKQLADRVGLDPGDIIAYLDGLYKAGYIQRDRDPADRRRQIVAVTPAGVDALDNADRALDAMEEDTFASLAVAEKTSFAEQLARLSESLGR